MIHLSVSSVNDLKLVVVQLLHTKSNGQFDVELFLIKLCAHHWTFLVLIHSQSATINYNNQHYADLFSLLQFEGVYWSH